ncbi:Y-family DNA polymerase [Paenibacillus jiagnxiensis]|uniref:Y-family DNA polymerase n=1 Tax=Paenibacillus jiagnxiensis TaxID=3228926 RepID=UPI0038D40D2D
MKSFYASVEAVSLGLDPLTCLLAVVGDKNRSGSVVLAASPVLKKEFGIRTGSRLYEIPPDPRIRIVNARMGLYLDTSMQITDIFNQYAPKEAISTYSIDESWVICDGLERLFGSAHDIARSIQEDIKLQTGLPVAIGIGPNKLLAKMVLDIHAKKKGIAECKYEDIPRLLWPTPIEDVWGIGHRMKRNLNRMGIYILEDLAKCSLAKLKQKYGVMGEQLYYHAWGVDLSPIFVDPSAGMRKGFSNGITLMRDYNKDEVPTVIYEITDHLASRMREINAACRTVSLSFGYSKHEVKKGFSRSHTLPEATNVSKRLYDTCMALYSQANVLGKIRTVHVAVSNLVSDDAIQLDLFSGAQDEKLRLLGSAIDEIHARFGGASVFRACSLTDAGTHLGRTKKIGGHFQ